MTRAPGGWTRVTPVRGGAHVRVQAGFPSGDSPDCAKVLTTR